MLSIDLNCDLGESYGPYKLGLDEEIVPLVTSANIACGFHAGDPGTMHRTIQLALKHGTAIGAHPGLPDLAGFGRRNLDITPQEAFDMVVYQVGALYGFVKAEGVVMQHVKPHGALYNMAERDSSLAEAIAEGVYRVEPGLILFGLAGGKLVKAGQKLGLQTAEEVFADRTYLKDGNLVPRTQPGALITDPIQAVRQVIGMVKEGKVQTLEGGELSVKADTVCLHGDGAKALEFVCLICQELKAAGIMVQAFGSR